MSQMRTPAILITLISVGLGSATLAAQSQKVAGLFVLVEILLVALALTYALGMSFREPEERQGRTAPAPAPAPAPERHRPPVTVWQAPAPQTQQLPAALPEGYEAIVLQAGQAHTTQRHVTPSGAAVEIEIETSAGATVTARVTDATQRHAAPRQAGQRLPRSREIRPEQLASRSTTPDKSAVGEYYVWEVERQQRLQDGTKQIGDHHGD